MPDSDLMFRSAIELAAMVRSGELSARELVQASLDRIEELNPRLNAFVQVDAERALAAAAEIGARRRAAVRGRPDRDQEQPARQRPAPHLRLLADWRTSWPTTTTTSRGASSRPGSSSSARRRCPSMASCRRPRRGCSAHAQPLGPRALPGRVLRRSGRRGRVGHGARRARQRRRRLDPHPRRLLRPRRPQAPARAHLRGARTGRVAARDRRRADPHRRRHRRDPRRARRLRDRRRHLGPAARAAIRSRRRAACPRRLRIAVTTLPPIADAVVDPLCVQRRRRGRGTTARTRARRARGASRRGRSRGLPSSSARSSAPTSGSRSPSPGWSPGASRRAEDMEPMSWAIFSMVKKLNAVEGFGATMRLEAFTRQLVQFMEPYDALLTPALAERPLPLGTLDPAAPDPMETFTRVGALHAVHARVQRKRPARDLGAALPRRGRPPARRAARRAPRAGGHADRARRTARRGPAVGRAAAGAGGGLTLGRASGLASEALPLQPPRAV